MSRGGRRGEEEEEEEGGRDKEEEEEVETTRRWRSRRVRPALAATYTDSRASHLHPASHRVPGKLSPSLSRSPHCSNCSNRWSAAGSSGRPPHRSPIESASAVCMRGAWEGLWARQCARYKWTQGTSVVGTAGRAGGRAEGLTLAPRQGGFCWAARKTRPAAGRRRTHACMALTRTTVPACPVPSTCVQACVQACKHASMHTARFLSLAPPACHTQKNQSKKDSARPPVAAARRPRVRSDRSSGPRGETPRPEGTKNGAMDDAWERVLGRAVDPYGPQRLPAVRQSYDRRRPACDLPRQGGGGAWHGASDPPAPRCRHRMGPSAARPTAHCPSHYSNSL